MNDKNIHPEVVLDNNILRHGPEIALRLEAFRDRGEQVAIPEIALFEMTKSPTSWEGTIESSLRLLMEEPEAVVLTRSTKGLGVLEETTGVRTSSVVNAATTIWMQHVLRDRRGGGTRAYRQFLAEVQKHRGELEHEEHVRTSRDVIVRLVEIANPALESSLRRAVVRELSAGRREVFRQFCGENLRLEGQRAAAVRRGLDPSVAARLAVEPTVSFMHALAIGVIALEWVIAGGVQAADAQRIANDVLDVEYILAGFWIGKLVTEDRRARDRFGDLQQVFSALWPDSAKWLERASCSKPVNRIAE